MKISLVGMGMGNPESLTLQAQNALYGAEAVLGAPRLIDALCKQENTEYLSISLPTEVARQIRQHPEWKRVCVALSGDVGFYSGAIQLLTLLEDFAPELICGISSPQQLAAKMGIAWQDFKLVSCHGKQCDVLAEVLNHPKVFFLTGSNFTADRICRELSEAGLGEANVTVGENLGTDQERILNGTAIELSQQHFATLSVILVENQKCFVRNEISPGIKDELFIRGKAPMTKREVRVNILSLLNIREDDLLYDIGGGTGSVAVEMALLARRGRVFAFETEAEACNLIQQNKEKFGVYNLEVRHGYAPEALMDLPAPNNAFVGGSKGEISGIVDCLLEKNPQIRVVISAVTLETLQEAMEALQSHSIANVEVTQISVSRATPTGRLHMLRAQNPVFLISGGGHGEN